MAISTYLLNFNYFKCEWIKCCHKKIWWLNGFKNVTSICCLQETHFKWKDTYRQEVKGWKKIFHANRSENKVMITILLSDKIEFKTKNGKKDKEVHYIILSCLSKKRT